MSGWAIDCEWAFVGMKRDQAVLYYGQQFESFKTASTAHTASAALLWYTVTLFSIATVITFVLLICCCCNPGNAGETSAVFAGL
jgi:hypothetical protein